MAKQTRISKNKIAAIVLMAGKGTRMKSEIPKVMHKIIGKPMGWYVINALQKAGIKNRLLVTGYRSEIVAEYFKDEKTVLQEPQLGTGHALMTALKAIPKNITHILVINGDTPLLTSDSIKGIIAELSKNNSAVVTVEWNPDPGSLGRIIIDDSDTFVAIKEAVDLVKHEKDIEWVNVGLYAFEVKALEKYIKKIKPSNKQSEYYITDIPGLMAKDGLNAGLFYAIDESFMIMPNDRIDLADASSCIQNRILRGLMEKGVTICDPHRTYIEHDVKISRDVIIYPDTYLMGKTSIEKHSQIGPMTSLSDTKVGQNAKIHFSSIDKARIDDNCVVGPFSHIRPETHLKSGAKVGNFVEIKKSVIGADSKINHLSYIGDATIGKRVNIGAGTITCNYDGSRKHKTVIGDGAFIGSDSILVAPVKIGAGTLTGAGSVITRDVPPGKIVMGIPARVVERKTNYSDK